MSTTPIDVPSYLSDEDYGIATAAVSCGNGCMAEQDDPCGTGEWCGECSCQGIECGGCETAQGCSQSSCGTCQSGQSCSQSSGCGTCQSCMAEQGDPCGTGEWCSECSCQGWECGGCETAQTCSESCSQSGDCGTCQSWTQDCGTSQYGPCNNCEGWCESSNQCSCESGECGSCESGQCSSCQSGCQGCEGCQTACENAAQRPANASWTTTIASNSQIKLTAAEWNAFTAAINLFRTYKGLGAATFTTVAAGDHIKQEHFTQARSAINDMSPPSPVPGVPGIITAASLNGLMASLNSIQ